mmetsp:Transcript_32373/g.48871  ORF Transcript_32373/g.48871 Transcript_32373/m.48871 type:complete len:1072 (-) Transcript_32373:136-3351(-)
MSALSKKEQVALLLRNLYEDQHPDLADIEVTGWTTLPKVMKADPNTINALKNKDGVELGRALSEDDLEMLQYGISYINYLQIERGVIAEVGLLDVDKISADAFARFVDAEEDHIKYTSGKARIRAKELLEHRLMVEEAASKQTLLKAQIASAQAQSTQSNTGSQGNQGLSSQNQNTASGFASNQNNKPEEFKGKLDTLITNMPEFHEDTNFTNWFNMVKLLAHATKCFEVLDPNYAPSTPTEKSAFVARQNAMFLALNANVKSKHGQTILLTHLPKADAQQVFKDLTAHYSGPGSIVKDDIVTTLYASLMTPHPDHYVKGTLADTLEAWEQTLLEHDNTKGVPTSPAEKKVMFDRFIQNMRVLDHVANLESVVSSLIDAMFQTASTNTNTPPPVMGPDQVINLYKQQALRLDKKRRREVLEKRHRISTEVKCLNQIYSAYELSINLGPSLEDDQLSDEKWFQVFTMSSRNRPKPGFMPGGTFHLLTKEEKRLWHEFTPETRELILSARSNSAPTLRGPSHDEHSTTDVIDEHSNTDVVPHVKTARKSGTNPTSRYKSGSDPRRKGPVNHRGRANVAEQKRAEEERIQANVSELRRFHVNVSEGLFNESTSFLDSVRAAQNHEQVLQVHQTSQLPPFDPIRLLSVPEDEHVDNDGDDDVSAADDDVGDEADATGDDTPAHDAVDREVNATEGVEPSDDDSSDGNSASDSWGALDDDTVESDHTTDLDVEFYAVHLHNQFESDGIDIDDESTRFICAHEFIYGHLDVTPQSYRVTNTVISTISGMIDRGANGGVAGDPKFLRTISVNDGEEIDIIGINNHTINRVQIGTVGGVARIAGPDGPMEVIVVFHNYALLNSGKSIHSALQLEAFRNIVDDTAIQYGGTQTITTTQGHVFPLDIRNGLVHLPTRAFTDDEFRDLPRITMTSADRWNPNIANSSISDDPSWYASQAQPDDSNTDGEYVFVTADSEDSEDSEDELPALVTDERTSWYTDATRLSRSGELFGISGLIDRGANAGIAARGLISNEMGSSESPFLQLVRAQVALNQGSVEPRIRELYGRRREQVHTDTLYLEN